jgi:3-oxo-4-pregnene-20-carboxyl-CoA dehydrogenase alpha subunit
VLPVTTYGTAAQQTELLNGVADGAVLTAALRDAPGAPALLTGTCIDGVRIGVPYAAQARRVLVPTPGGTAVLDPHGAGVTLIRTPTSTGAPEYTLRLDGAPVLDVIAATPEDIDRFAVAGAVAVADGTIDGALALTAAHVRDRTQFGKPLATFQAVAQQIADVYVTARTMHLAATSAAWRLGTGRDARDDLAVAAYWLASEVPGALQTCHHLHGGLGVDVTYPLHRFSSLAKDLARFVGGAARRLDALGAACSSN